MRLGERSVWAVLADCSREYGRVAENRISDTVNDANEKDNNRGTKISKLNLFYDDNKYLLFSTIF